MRETIDRLKHLFNTYGNRAYGPEPVTLLHHSMQCAMLACNAGLSATMVAAAGLHDIGHLLLLDGGGTYVDGGDQHEAAGADFLAACLPASALMPIRWHVEAKRYLVSAEPGYADALSAGSLESLHAQGGPMTEAEMLTFRSVEGYRDAILLRRLDERAKRPKAPGMPLSEFLLVVGEAARSMSGIRA